MEVLQFNFKRSCQREFMWQLRFVKQDGGVRKRNALGETLLGSKKINVCGNAIVQCTLINEKSDNSKKDDRLLFC